MALKGPVVKTFRACDQDQPMLLPPDLREWLAPDHTARMVDELVEYAFDLSRSMTGMRWGVGPRSITRG